MQTILVRRIFINVHMCAGESIFGGRLIKAHLPSACQGASFRSDAIRLCYHGSVKVALSRIKNPSKSPFTKGDFQIPPLEKGEGGFLDKRNQFIEGKN